MLESLKRAFKRLEQIKDKAMRTNKTKHDKTTNTQENKGTQKKQGQVLDGKGDKKKYVAYYRVSTKKQGESGLGLEAQKSLVARSMDGVLIAEFVEVESGKNDKRVELEKAIAKAKEAGATLIIAKLDRLSRNVSFIFKLRDSGVNFVCCDVPNANTLTIAIFAGLAQQERELISQRTKAALAEKKRHGVKLGKPENLTHKGQIKGAQANKDKFLAGYAQIAEVIKTKHEYERLSYRQIVERINTLGYRTITGKLFTLELVHRIAKSF